MNKFLNLFLKGILVGIANIIPGVSGGTIAVVLRVFDQLIDAINNFFKEPKKHIKFLIPLILGGVLGVLIFSKIIEICLSKESLPTSIFFVGLVAGSIPLIYNQARKKEVKPIYYLASVISFIIVVAISFFSEPNSDISDIVITIPWLIKIFISSMIASAAMVIPGISGSFVMVLLGLYNIILLSISSFIPTTIDGIKLMSSSSFTEGILHIFKSDYFTILAVAGVGIIIGVILISKLISFLLNRFFSVTYFTILGLIFGSIFSIFKDPITYSSYSGNIPILSIVLAIVFGILGFFIALKMGKEQ